MRCFIILASIAGGISSSSAAQVAISPAQIRPAAWERIAVRVVNQTDSAIVAVKVTVPEAFDILGVEPMPDWQFALTRTTEAESQHVTWTGGALGQWEFQEFAIFGRIGPDSRNKELVFPVDITKQSGSVVEWSWRDGAAAPPPTIRIVGSTEISSWGTFAAAAAAMGVALLAIALAVSRRPRQEVTA